MPCIKCSNGKYKYGKKGRCQFDTLEKCQQAAAAIHAQEADKTLEGYTGCCEDELSLEQVYKQANKHN